MEELMKKLKFFKCKHCGNVVVKLVDKAVPLFCCGVMMEEILPNTVEAAVEKHLPVVKQENGIVEVKVGEVAHPMEEVHFINFVVVETENGFSISSLAPLNAPEAKVYVGNSKVLAVYEYCNLHGLWKIEL